MLLSRYIIWKFSYLKISVAEGKNFLHAETQRRKEYKVLFAEFY